MAIAYVGGQVAGRANPSAAVSVNYALTGGLASVPAAGDFVVVTAVTGSAAGNPAMAVTTPATWSALGQLNQSAVTADVSLNVSHKFMPATPDTAVTIPGTTNNAWGEAYAIQVFRGVDPTTPMDVTPVSAGGTGTGRPNPGQITPATAGAWVLICGGGAAGTGAVYVAPANFTTDFLTANGADTTDAMVGSGYWDGWTSGAVDPAAYTGGTTGANDSWAAYTLALRPAPETITGTGTPASQASTADGSGTSSSTGTGLAISGSATVDGAGTAGDPGSTGTGALLSGASTVLGVGVSLSTGIGALVAQAASAEGQGVSLSSGTGVLLAGLGTVDATGVSLSTGSGNVGSGSSTLHGLDAEPGAAWNEYAGRPGQDSGTAFQATPR